MFDATQQEWSLPAQLAQLRSIPGLAYDERVWNELNWGKLGSIYLLTVGLLFDEKILLFDKKKFLPFDKNRLEPCFLTKMQSSTYILQFLSNIAKIF